MAGREREADRCAFLSGLHVASVSGWFVHGLGCKFLTLGLNFPQNEDRPRCFEYKARAPILFNCFNWLGRKSQQIAHVVVLNLAQLFNIIGRCLFLPSAAKLVIPKIRTWVDHGVDHGKQLK